jgi:hypothetical protein
VGKIFIGDLLWMLVKQIILILNFKNHFCLSSLFFNLDLFYYMLIYNSLNYNYRFYIKSGNLEHPGDTIPVDSTIEIKTKNLIDNNERFFKIGNFSNNGIANGKILSDYGPIEELQINIYKNITNWIIINEIAFLSH